MRRLFFIIPVVTFIGICAVPLLVWGVTDDIQTQIETKKQAAREIQEKIDRYKRAIEQKQKEVATLKSQLDIIDTRVEKTKLEMKSTSVTIDAVGQEIALLNLSISDKSEEINERKRWIASLLRGLNRADQTNYLEKFVTHQSISELINERQNVSDVSKNVSDALRELATQKSDLEVNKKNRAQRKQQLQLFHDKLESKKEILQEEQGRKTDLISDTKKSEKKFQVLLEELKRQAKAIESEVYSLEEAMRAKLKKEGKLQALGEFSVMWPVGSRYVTSRFHDPEYPFRHVFEHPGTDIRAAQGTPIKAAASGYVARAKDNGMGYSYVLLIHGNGFSTLYGHVSAIYVKQGDFVQQGETIAASGGTPGTRGAGPFVTGAHLHFEVRKDGLPLDAEQFLP